jgi:putative transposase
LGQARLRHGRRGELRDAPPGSQRERGWDNVFIERLWRSLKYEDVYLKGYAAGREAVRGIAEWIAFYNELRPHRALADRTPMAVWSAVAGAKAVDMMDNASPLPTYPQRNSRRSLWRHDTEGQTSGRFSN